MKPITEYQDYRKYLLDYFDWRKRTSAFSWREFSKQAGFASWVRIAIVPQARL